MFCLQTEHEGESREVEQWVRSELESTYLCEKIDSLSKTTKEDTQEPRKQRLKLIIISDRTFGMMKEGTKIMSIISVAGHQVVKNLSERRISTTLMRPTRTTKCTLEGSL